MVSKPDIGCMGIFGEEYGYLTGTHVEQTVGSVAEESDVFFLIIFLAGMLERINGSPAYDFLALDGDMDVDETAMGLKSHLLAGQKGRFFGLDENPCSGNFSHSLYKFVG